MQMYYDRDAHFDLLKGKKIAILGYGSQGHAQSQNLRDSGMNVMIAELKGTPNYKKAVADGWTPVSAAEAAQKADIVQMLVPDEIHRKVYYSEVADGMNAGKALVFSHGFNIHYKQIVPPEDVDVYMVAPKGPGHLVRRTYTEGTGVPCLIAVEQDPSGQAKDLAIAHACGIGGGRAGIIETTFAEETETDLLGEQAVLCGGVTELIKAGFDTLVEAGYQPEIAYFECLNELKLIVDMIYEGGLGYMRYSISDTAEYGDYISGKRIITEETRKEMKKMLTEIRDGTFARQWLLENQVGRPVYNARKRQEENHLIEQVGKKLRGMMSWLQEK